MTITAVFLLVLQMAMPKMMTLTVLEIHNPGNFKVRDSHTQLVMDFKTCNDKTDFTVGHTYSVAYNTTPRGCSQIVGLKQLD